MNTIDTIRTNDIATMTELLDITRDGALFFGEAAKTVDNPKLKTIFKEITETRTHFVDALTTELKTSPITGVPMANTPLKGGSPKVSAMASADVRNSWHKLYTDFRGKLGDKSYGFTKDVQASEDRLLKAYNNVTLDSNVPTPVKNVVTKYLPTMRKQFELIRDRKWAVAA